MISLAVNHRTTPGLSTGQLAVLAAKVGLAGVELCKDLDQPMFGTAGPKQLGADMRALGLKVFAIGPVDCFTDADDAMLTRAEPLAATARDAGARGLVLCPRRGDTPVERSETLAAVTAALTRLAPLLHDYGLTGLVDPHSAETSLLRYKADVAEALLDMDSDAPFGLVHDTLHHHLSQEPAIFPAQTRMVRLSGVSRDTPADRLTDADRGLVDARDRVDAIAQLAALGEAGYVGPASITGCSPEVHAIADPGAALTRTMAFVQTQLARKAA